MRRLRFTSVILAAILSCCSPASQAPKYDFDEENGSYDQCEFDGEINGKRESDETRQPYFHVIGHGFEKKINGFWYPDVNQWRSKNGRVITFISRDGTGSGDSRGYWYGTLNGKRAGGYTVVPRFQWMFTTWDGDTDFVCHNPGEEEF
jgi:hypothetical protein